jgi:hypothetical protein
VGILLSVYQIYLCGHSNRHQVMDQKSSFFILYGLLGLVPMIFSKILEVRGTKMKKIQKSAVRFDNLKQDFLDDKKYSGKQKPR